MGHGPLGSHDPDGQPPKQRGIPLESSLQTSLWPSQQSCGALMLPPPGSTGAPQVSPTFWQAVPWVQRRSVGLHSTEASTPPGREESARQHSDVSLQESPWRRHPVAGWQTWAPEPMSTQRFEQQFEPPLQGVPPWLQPPLASRHRPGCPPDAEQRFEQQSEAWRQRSPGAWQEYAATQRPPWQFVEQHSAPEAQAPPTVRQVASPAGSAQSPLAPQVPLQHSPPEAQAEAAVVPGGLHGAQAFTPEPTSAQVPPQQSPGATHAAPAGLQ